MLRRVDTYRGSLLSKKESLLSEILEGEKSREERRTSLQSGAPPKQVAASADVIVEEESSSGEKALEVGKESGLKRRMIPKEQGGKVNFLECVNRAVYFHRREEMWKKIEEEMVSFRQGKRNASNFLY